MQHFPLELKFAAFRTALGMRDRVIKLGENNVTTGHRALDTGVYTRLLGGSGSCIWSGPRDRRGRIEGSAGGKVGCRRMLLLTHGAETGFEFGLCRPETAPPLHGHVLPTIVLHTIAPKCACVRASNPHATFRIVKVLLSDSPSSSLNSPLSSLPPR